MNFQVNSKLFVLLICGICCVSSETPYSDSFCPAGYVRFGHSKCFKLSQYPGPDYSSYTSAQSLCKSYNGNLASIPDVKTLEFLLTYIVREPIPSWAPPDADLMKILVGGVRKLGRWFWLDLNTDFEFQKYFKTKTSPDFEGEVCVFINTNSTLTKASARNNDSSVEQIQNKWERLQFGKCNGSFRYICQTFIFIPHHIHEN